MVLNVICGNRGERLPRLMNEIKTQNIDYNLWEGVFDPKSVIRSINLAHKKIVQYAKDTNMECICIAEDDVQFTCPTSYKYFIENIPQEYDLYLGGIYLGDIQEDKSVKHFTGMHLYIIHNKFYDTFLSTDPNTHIDIALADLGYYKVCNPFAAIQFNGFSANTGKEENYDAIISNRELYCG